LVEQGGATVEARGKDGRTPLHIACEDGHLDVVRFLVEQGGAAVEAQSNNGSTPLSVAKKRIHREVVSFLQTWEIDKPEHTAPTVVSPAPEDPTQQGAPASTSSSAATALNVTPEQAAVTAPQIPTVAPEAQAPTTSPTPTQSVSNQVDRNAVRAVMDKRNDPSELSPGYIESLTQKELVGKGAFGLVYKVKDESLGCWFALKQIVWTLPDPKQRAVVEKTIKTEIAVSSTPTVSIRVMVTQHVI
jgi:Ankyrin repeats (3 copies)